MPECPTHVVAPTIAYAPCALLSRHEETRRLYEFLMRLRPEIESSRAQLLHSPTAYTLDEAFALVLTKETRLRASSTGPGAGAALAAQHFAPLATLGPSTPRPPAASSESSRPLAASFESSRPPRPKKPVTCYHCSILNHIERDCRKKQRGFPRVSAPKAPSLSVGSPLLLTPPFQALCLAGSSDTLRHCCLPPINRP